MCLNGWTNVPSRPSRAHTQDPSLGVVPTRATCPLPLDRPAECICLSWAFFPFTHSLCRDGRQISIIHKQLSYLPQRMSQVCVYWFKINNLHSWRGGTFPGWQHCIWTWRRECCCWETWRMNVNERWRLKKVLWIYFDLKFSGEMEKAWCNILTSVDRKWKIWDFDREGQRPLALASWSK